ncbi:MAG: MFS transporter [Candidatus Asgardarchaeia archaeon]
MKRIDKIFYGMGRFGSTTLLSVVSLATFYIYLKKYELDPFLNGIANGIGKIVIALSGFIIGYISDKTIHPKLGRRKPYIISGSFALAVSFMLLFLPDLFIPISNQYLLFIYETIWVSSFNFFYGYLLTPYQAWLPEITLPEERVEVSGYENTFNLLGNIVGIVGSFSLPLIIQQGGSLLIYTVAILAFVEILFYLPAYLRIQEPKKYISHPSIIKETLIAIKNKNYVTWLIAQGFMSLGFTILITIVLVYVEDILLLTGLMYFVFAGVLLIFVLSFFAVWGYLSKKFKIKRTMTAALVILIFVLPLTWLIGRYPLSIIDILIVLIIMGYVSISLLTTESYKITARKVFSSLIATVVYLLWFTVKVLDVSSILAALLGVVPLQYQGLLLVALAASGLSGYWLFPYVIIAHIVEVDEIITGESRAGMYTGFNNIPLNIFQATAYVLTGYLTGLPNMLGYYLWGPVSAIFIFIGLLIFLKVETDPDFQKLREMYGREKK